jgi:hypothetical protein
MERYKIKVDVLKVSKGHQGKRGTVAFAHKCTKRAKTRNAILRKAMAE